MPSQTSMSAIFRSPLRLPNWGQPLERRFGQSMLNSKARNVLGQDSGTVSSLSAHGEHHWNAVCLKLRQMGSLGLGVGGSWCCQRGTMRAPRRLWFSTERTVLVRVGSTFSSRRASYLARFADESTRQGAQASPRALAACVRLGRDPLLERTDTLGPQVGLKPRCGEGPRRRGSDEHL